MTVIARLFPLACAALLAQSAHTVAAAGMPKDQAELTQEVALRCIYEMGEFGDDAVLVCMRADLAAAEALTRYPPEAQGIVARCFDVAWTRGYGVVQFCVEQDLKASVALDALGTQHAATIQSCREKVGAEGPASVKRCVDAALAPK